MEYITNLLIPIFIHYLYVSYIDLKVYMYMLTSDSARLVLKQLIDSIQPYIEPILKESEGR